MNVSILAPLRLVMLILTITGSCKAISATPHCKEPVYLPMEVTSPSGIVGGSKQLSSHRGQVTLVSGVRLNAAMFDGSTSAMLTDRRDSCFTDPELCNEGMTMSFWVKFLSFPSNEFYVLSNGGQTRHSYGYCLLVKAHKLLTIVKTKSTEWLFTSSNTLELNVWDLLTFTWSEENGLKVYMNGDQLDGNVVTSSKTITSTSLNQYRLGLPNNNENSNFFGHFIIDELMYCAIWMPSDDVNRIFKSEIGEEILHAPGKAYTIRKDEKLTSEVQHLTSSHRPFLMSCLRSCNVNDHCVTTVYNKSSLECKLYNVLNYDLASTVDKDSVMASKKHI